MRLATVACATAVIAATVTAAQAGEASGTTGGRDGTTALVLSAGGAGLSVGLFVAGFARDSGGLAAAGMLSAIVTPSIGHWYAGEAGGTGIAIRAGGTTLFFVGAATCLDDVDCRKTKGPPLMVLGGAAIVGAVIYDIATAPRAAARSNAKHGYVLAPTMVSTGGAATAGLGLAGSF